MKLVRGLVAAALVAQLTGCSFAVKHPAVTVGIVGGTVGLGSCELATENHPACFAVGGSVAAVLGLITAVAMWTMGGDPDDHVLRDEALEQPIHAGSGSGGGPLDPPPGPLDPPPGAPAIAPDPATPTSGSPAPVEPRPQLPIPRLPEPGAGSTPDGT